MAILKLALGKQNAISGTVQAVTLDTSGKFGPQYKVEFTTGDTLYLNKDPFERQTTRLNKLPNELEGEVVTFWKKADPNDAAGVKGFLNVELGNTTGSAGAMSARSLTEDNVTRDLRNVGALMPKKDYDQIKADYVQCIADAVAIINDTNEAFDTNLGGPEIMSAAATLYIQRARTGV